MATKNGRGAGAESTEAATQLRGAVSRASLSLNALANGWKETNTQSAKTTHQHLRVQCQAASQLTAYCETHVPTHENNIEQCLDLLERLEKAEQLALKIKSLRGTVDRIAGRLDKRAQSSIVRS